MGEVSRPLPTSPAPASLRAAGASGTVDIRTDGLPTIGAPDSPERWQADWQYRAPACVPLVSGAYGCPIPDAESLKGWDPGTPLIWEGKPYGIEAQLECSLPLGIGGGSSEAEQAAFVEEARLALERGLVPMIANELYNGTIARNEVDNGHTAYDQNRWITRLDDPVDPVNLLGGFSATATEGAPLSGAIGYLEQYLATCSFVGRGVIHVPPFLLTPLAAEGQTLSPTTTGGARFSASGHTVVADFGYNGNGPADADEAVNTRAAGVMWIYATGPITVRYSLGAPLGTVDEVAAFFLPNNNTTAQAPALAMATWGCCHAAVPVDITPYESDGS